MCILYVQQVQFVSANHVIDQQQRTVLRGFSHDRRTSPNSHVLGAGSCIDLVRFIWIAADSEGWRSAFRTDVDHDSEVMAISIPN
jgi:hypothetical protein